MSVGKLVNAYHSALPDCAPPCKFGHSLIGDPE
jgi:hypothetical protein